MSNPTNSTIVDRVVERLKAQPLGDLITEEDLHDIVKEAIPRAFFQKRTVPATSGYNRMEEKEPLIVEVFRNLVAPTVAKAVSEWMIEHTEEVTAYWKKVMDEGIFQYVQKLQSDQATLSIRVALADYLRGVNEDRMRRGLPTITL